MSITPKEIGNVMEKGAARIVDQKGGRTGLERIQRAIWGSLKKNVCGQATPKNNKPRNKNFS